MKYTLDSLHQVETSLKNVFKAAKIQTEQTILTGNQLERLTKENINMYYFGVITSGNTNFVKVYYGEDLVITIDPKNQIIVPFTRLEYVNDIGEIKTVQGQFRGAIIRLNN